MNAPNKRTIAIGDIHGCYYTLLELLRQIQYKSTEDTLIFLGDYVVSQLQHLQEQVGKDRCICLRGNHEQMVVDGRQDIWAYNGGLYTLADFDRHGAEIPIEWFESLPLYYYHTKDYIFCHAGLTYPYLIDNSKNDLLWGRSWIDIDRRPREKTVVFGHTPSMGQPYRTMTGDIGIDCGCVFGGKLCAIIISENGEFSFTTVNKAPEDMEGKA